MRLAALDSDGDGHLSEDELKMFHEIGGNLVEAHLSAFLNQGVVTALVLSITFPLAVGHELGMSWNGEVDDSTTYFIFRLIAYIALLLVTGISMGVLVTTSLLFSQLTYMMPTLTSKIWLINKVRKLLTHIEVGKQQSVTCMAVYLLSNALATSTWLGLLAVFPLILAIMGGQAYVGYSIKHGGMDKQLQDEAKVLLGLLK